MEAKAWLGCSLVSVDPEVVHGEPVFMETRMPVETAIENYYAFRELQGLGEEQAIQATLDCFPTIPGAEGLRAVLAYEAAHQPQFQP